MRARVLTLFMSVHFVFLSLSPFRVAFLNTMVVFVF
jgi:hypothetical protein